MGASFNTGNVTQMVAHTGNLVNVFTNYGFISPLLTADNNYVWIASTDNDSLTQLDPVTGAYVQAIRTGSSVSQIT
jgi:hypothetical protein